MKIRPWSIKHTLILNNLFDKIGTTCPVATGRLSESLRNLDKCKGVRLCVLTCSFSACLTPFYPMGYLQGVMGDQKAQADYFLAYLSFYSFAFPALFSCFAISLFCWFYMFTRCLQRIQKWQKSSKIDKKLSFPKNISPREKTIPLNGLITIKYLNTILSYQSAERSRIAQHVQLYTSKYLWIHQKSEF